MEREVGQCFKRASVSGKIGKSGSHHSPAYVVLSVHVPNNAEIQSVKAYFANMPWGHGESDYSPTHFTECPIIGHNGQGYAEWGSGWARAKLVAINSGPSSQSVLVRFETWKHDNSRRAQLEVEFCYHS